MAEKATSVERHESAEHSEQHEHAIERARKSLEKEQKPDKAERAEDVRKDVEKLSQSHEAEKSSKKAEKAPQVSVTVKDKKQSYALTMKRVRARMNPARKAFSSFIHAPVVEQVSETASKTIARPSGIIGGAVAVIIGLGVVTFYARRSGFELAGSEFMLLLVAGFGVGLLFEVIAKIFNRR